MELREKQSEDNDQKGPHYSNLDQNSEQMSEGLANDGHGYLNAENKSNVDIEKKFKDKGS